MTGADGLREQSAVAATSSVPTTQDLDDGLDPVVAAALDRYMASSFGIGINVSDEPSVELTEDEAVDAYVRDAFPTGDR